MKPIFCKLLFSIAFFQSCAFQVIPEISVSPQSRDDVQKLTAVADSTKILSIMQTSHAAILMDHVDMDDGNFVLMMTEDDAKKVGIELSVYYKVKEYVESKNN